MPRFATPQSMPSVERPRGSVLVERPIPQALLSGALLYAAFPPLGWDWLAWVALVPLLLLVRSTAPRRRLYLAVWLGGLAFWLPSVEWIRRIFPSAWVAWLCLAFYLSLYWPLFFALVRLSVMRFRLPLVVAAPVAWVALEYVRSYVLGGFPWFFLAHAQTERLAIVQFADLAGAWGVTFLVAAINAWCVDLLTRPLLIRTAKGPRVPWYQARRILILGALVGAAVIYGSVRLSERDRFRDGPKWALIQTNYPQGKPSRPTADEILLTYRRLLDAAVLDRPDAVIWPETSYPFGFVLIDKSLAPSELARQAQAVDPESKPQDWEEGQARVSEQFRIWAQLAGAPMVFGVTSYEFVAGGPHKYNAAVLIDPAADRDSPNREFPIYRKIHLVPFGEYVPFVRLMPWLSALSPYQGGTLPSLTAGRTTERFRLGGVVAAPIICFEDTIPYVVRRWWTDGGSKPDVLLNLTNDGWYEDSAEHEVHLMAAAMRCIELRVPMVRSVNTGISAVIDGNGSVVARYPKVVAGHLTASMPLDDRESVYSRAGDWLPLSCLAITIGLIPLSWSRVGRSARKLD